ncbi:hypothetical protein DFH09DRAFT_1271034 [Mycena vulgaris]|nr:hypothetical protein DFH09DRAFT_1271034 [Mycena vulgaris]
MNRTTADNDSLRKDWAISLDKNSPMTAYMAVKYDDVIVQALFGQINPRPPHRQHAISKMSKDAYKISAEEARQFLQLFESARPALFASQQLADLEVAMSLFLTGLQPWMQLIGGGRGSSAMKWFVEAYSILLAPWCIVRLRVLPMGPSSQVQFGIFAREDIQEGDIVWEMMGMLSSTAEKNARHTHLSEMKDWDSVNRILYGPVRFVNHDCSPNVVYHYLPLANLDGSDTENSETSSETPSGESDFSVVVVALRNIQRGEEILVNYGHDYFPAGCPCHTCRPSGTGQGTAQRGSAPQRSRIIDPDEQQAAVKAKKVKKRAIQRVKRAAKKAGKI